MTPSASPASDVSNCFVFKSRLQEYTQKTGIATPVYETTKEGPSHEPTFRSTVTVNNVRYDSLPGFYNRKAAEQSAAEVAFLALLKSGNMSQFSHPVHETGLCKNLLQEYAQKMNYAIPCYTTSKNGVPGKLTFACIVEIGGIRYIGAAAKTKKEAEIKAARTALLAIQSSTSMFFFSGKIIEAKKLALEELASNHGAPEINGEGEPVYTVLPSKKKTKELEEQNVVKPLKPKKARFKKGSSKKKFHQVKAEISTPDLDDRVTREVILPVPGPEQISGDIDQHLHRPEEVFSDLGNNVPKEVTVPGLEQVSVVSDQHLNQSNQVSGDIDQHLCQAEQIYGGIDWQLHQLEHLQSDQCAEL